MQLSKQPRDDIAESAKGAGIPLFAPERGLEPLILKALPVSVLLGLIMRIWHFTHAECGRIVPTFKDALAQVKLRTLHLIYAVQKLLFAAFRFDRIIFEALVLRGSHARLGIRSIRRPFFAALIVMGSVPAAYFTYCAATLPFAGSVSVQRSPGILVLEADDNREIARRGVFKGERISAHDMPAELSSAVIAIEDRRFYQHAGVDLRSTIRAAWHDLLGGRVEGGSTITQQLARMLYLSPERTLKRKVQEAILAIWLEHKLSKQEILARYLDTAYFGDGVYGADAAAKHYFGKGAKALSLSEAAMLAGIIRAPSALNPDRHIERARRRAAVVLDAMVETGAISQQQAKTARQKAALLRVPTKTPSGSNYFVDTAAAEVKSLFGSNSGDLTVRTTLNRQLQQIAENVISKRLAVVGRAKNVHQAALVAMAPDGAVLAMVGGRDYNESQFNRATQARRQPGSLFKLFVYLAAMRRGLTPETVVIDRPVQIGDWEPENYGDRYYGPVNVRTAFAHSLNSVAVQIADRVGTEAVIDTARKLGVQSELPAVPSVALGSGQVTLLEMTRAFAAVAANATKVETYTVRGIAKGNQAVYTRSASHVTQADDPIIHSEMIDILASAVRDGTGKAARLDRPVAGKTGTSQDYRDAWFVGFTPDLVVGVWVGNDDDSPTRGVTGGSLPAEIWHDFVQDADSVRWLKAPLAEDVRAPAIANVVSRAEREGQSDLSSTNVVRGIPTVFDTGALELQGQVIRLIGVEGVGGRYARTLSRALRHREVTCTPAHANGPYECRIGDQDLSELIILNGVGLASADAGPELRDAEERAREARLGVWRHEATRSLLVRP